MLIYMYATDEDHALELAGNGADSEFESPADAARNFDPEVHGSRNLYSIEVREVPGVRGS